MKNLTVRLFSVAVLLAVTLSGCAVQQNDEAQQGQSLVLVSHEEAVRLYYARQQELGLPPGVSWKSELPVILQDDSLGHYFACGVGGQEAELQWYCIWAKQGLKTKSSADFAVLGGIQSMDVYAKADDVTRNIFDDIQADLISNGRTDSLAEYISINCE